MSNLPLCDFSLLRDLRKKSNMSIVELSERSGVSTSVISKLERNQTVAELDTLYRIARVFDMVLSDLIALAERRMSHVSVQQEYERDGFNFERVSFDNMRCMRVSAKRGCVYSKPTAHREDYEICWVTSGRIVLTLPYEKHELTSGMSVEFDASLLHEYEVLEDCELVIVHLRKKQQF